MRMALTPIFAMMPKKKDISQNVRTIGIMHDAFTNIFLISFHIDVYFTEHCETFAEIRTKFKLQCPYTTVVGIFEYSSVKILTKVFIYYVTFSDPFCVIVTNFDYKSLS